MSLVTLSRHPRWQHPDPRSAPSYTSSTSFNSFTFNDFLTPLRNRELATPLQSIASALFIHNGALQTLCFHNVSHSFPCSRGEGGLADSAPTQIPSPTVTSLPTDHPCARSSTPATTVCHFSSLPFKFELSTVNLFFRPSLRSPANLHLYFQSLPGCSSRNPFSINLLHCCRGVCTPLIPFRNQPGRLAQPQVTALVHAMIPFAPRKASFL